MAERTRPIRIEFCVTEQERRLIQNKMAQLGTKNMGAYLRKMAIDGYIINVDYTQQKKLAAAVSRAASNINQICRRINSSGHLYAEDVTELKERQAEITLQSASGWTRTATRSPVKITTIQRPMRKENVCECEPDYGCNR